MVIIQDAETTGMISVHERDEIIRVEAGVKRDPDRPGIVSSPLAMTAVLQGNG